MTLHVGVDRRTRQVEPGPCPGQALAQRIDRHGRETCRASATQCLQQEGLGLVALMVGATLTNLSLLGTSPVVPAGFLLFSGLVAWVRRERTRGLLTAVTSG